MISKFDESDIKKLFVPEGASKNGQVTVIGGSSLFHGAPLFSLKVASRIVDMVFFASPEPGFKEVSDRLKSELLSFIWVPWEEVHDYIQKSDSVLIGPGFMRYRTEKDEREFPDGTDEASEFTMKITNDLLKKFPDKKWVIDAGSLQVMGADMIPKNSILTPNKREYERLFSGMDVSEASEKYECTIILKGIKDIVSSKGNTVEIEGGNAGLSKGGTGDTLAGLVAALYAKNDAFISATSASYILKKSGDELYKKVGSNFNADDLSDKVPEILHGLLG